MVVLLAPAAAFGERYLCRLRRGPVAARSSSPPTPSPGTGGRTSAATTSRSSPAIRALDAPVTSAVLYWSVVIAFSIACQLTDKTSAAPAVNGEPTPLVRRLSITSARMPSGPWTECSTGLKEWLPIHHRFRTLRVSWSENQALRRFVRNAEPDPTRKCKQILQIEIWELTQQRMLERQTQSRGQRTGPK